MGKFIVFEGPDRVGKTTQANMLAEYLKSIGKKVYLTQYPNRHSKIGKLINEYLKMEGTMEPHAIHLLFTADRWENQNTIRTLLSDNFYIIVDRYIYSNIAYSMCRGLGIRWCFKSERDLIEPDVVIYFEGAKELGDEVHDNPAFQEKVKMAYMKVANKVKCKGHIPVWLTVDGNGSPEEIHKRILGKIELTDSLEEYKNDSFY